jgi:hypothetical protein
MIGNIPVIQLPPLQTGVVWYAPTFTDEHGAVQAFSDTRGYGAGLGATGGAGSVTVQFALWKSDKVTPVIIAGGVNTQAGTWNATLLRWEFRLPAALALPSSNSFGAPEPYYLTAKVSDSTNTVDTTQPSVGANWLLAIIG